MIRITIETRNAAFDADAGGEHEVARILRELADRYEQNMAYDFDVSLRDINGNRVGSAEWQPEVEG